MPVRLIKPYGGQAAGTTYFGSDEQVLRDTGNADDMVELATDYAPNVRRVTTPTANVTRTASTYYMVSATAQTLTVPLTGYLPTNSVITVIQKGAGAFTIAPAAGVTFGTALASYVSKGINNIAQIVKDGPDSWTIFGGVGG